MHVARDHVRQEALLEHCARRLKGERAHPVTDVEDDAALPGRQDVGPDAPSSIDGCIRKRFETVGKHVAPAKMRNHLVARRGRIVEVGHERHVKLISGFQRRVEGTRSVGTARNPSDPHLDADKPVEVILGAGYDLPRVTQADVGIFADHHIFRVSVDAGKGDIEIGQDARAGVVRVH
jgi:hypothetical protein